jgi:Fic family protein
MKIVNENDDPILFRFITDTNLLRQYDLLKTTVEVALSRDKDCIISEELIQQLNNAAVVFLTETPGKYRKEPVHITNSKHIPPPHEEVEGLMAECTAYLVDGWDKHSPTHLSAYALWRLNWIHPFVEGNGRTARATSYLAMCAKHGMWLPGANTIPMQIRLDRKPYYAALSDADEQWKNGKTLDLSTLEQYLDGLLTKQISP